MNVLITTLGQRDIQWIDERNKRTSCFHTKSLEAIQANLGKLEFRWKECSYNSEINNKDKRAITYYRLDHNVNASTMRSNLITFKMLESIFRAVCATTSIDVIYVFYTDRHANDACKPEFRKAEPWRFFEILTMHFSEIWQHYFPDRQLPILQGLNLCEFEPIRDDIKPEGAYEYFDTWIKERLLPNPPEHIHISDGRGISAISSSIEECLQAYFPDSITIWDCDYGRVNVSFRNRIKEYYKIRYELIQCIEEQDFNAALTLYTRNANLMGENHLLSDLLLLSHEWLHGDNHIVEKLVVKLEGYQLKPEIQKTVSLMNRIIAPNVTNAAKWIVCIDNWYHTKEYYGAGVLLISVLEMLMKDMIACFVPEGVSRIGAYTYYRLDKLSLKGIRPSDFRYDMFRTDDNNLIKENWQTSVIIVQLLMSHYSKDNAAWKRFKRIHTLVISRLICDLKETRNSYIHKGLSAVKEELEKHNIDATVNAIIDEIRIEVKADIHDYRNWIPEMQAHIINLINHINLPGA